MSALTDVCEVRESQKKATHFLAQADASVAGVSAKDAERGFVLHCGESTRHLFLAEETKNRTAWLEGLVLACNLEVRMTPELMQEIMDLFVVQTELVSQLEKTSALLTVFFFFLFCQELLSKQMETKPAVPPRPDNLDFVTGPIAIRSDLVK